ncbi:MAG: hypothetical protein WB660_22075 [Candidatus Sulfotelmatobacter sp.]
MIEDLYDLIGGPSTSINSAVASTISFSTSTVRSLTAVIKRFIFVLLVSDENNKLDLANALLPIQGAGEARLSIVSGLSIRLPTTSSSLWAVLL